ncbi:MAG: hypothetical protein ACK5KK_10850, partial [Microbacterium sp.]
MHVVTVGLSILDKLNRARESGRDTVAVRVGHQVNEFLDGWDVGDLTAENSAAALAWSTNTGAPEDDKLDGLQIGDLVAAIDSDEEQPGSDAVRGRGWLSAELDGLRAYAEHDDLDLLSPAADRDPSVLLASDSARGSAAALLNAGILAGGDWSRVCFGLDNGYPLVADGRVHVVRLTDLKPDSVEGFVTGLGNFGQGLYWAAGRNNNVHPLFVLHLSGGLKVALPFFLALGEWLRTTQEGMYRADAIAFAR